VADRHAVAAGEIDALIEATYRVIERAGSVEPTVREILAESGLSTQAFYRHFKSKDELMLVLLDDGRRRLGDYLRHQMLKASDPREQVRAWIEGTLEQVRDPAAANRTRPFARSLGLLQEQYPDEHRESVDVLVGLLHGPISQLVPDDEIHDSAMFVYLMTQGLLDRHLRELTTPTRDEVRRCVAFALRGVRAPA
jgi:AcrR family transcriptional regulator